MERPDRDHGRLAGRSRAGAELALPLAIPDLVAIAHAKLGDAVCENAWHRLRVRATNAVLPAWRVLDLRQQRTFHGLTQAALDAMTSQYWDS